MSCASGFAGEVHAISPSCLFICRHPAALRPPLSHGQQSNASSAATAKTTFLWIYRVLMVPKHPLVSSPAHKIHFQGGPCSALGLSSSGWRVQAAPPPRQQRFALLVKGSWRSALPSAEICKPDYIPKHMFGNEQQLSEVGGIALIENLQSRGGKPGSGSELPLGRATGSE